MFGQGATGLEYVLHWVFSGRTMEGLARALAVDIKRPGYTRNHLTTVFKSYGKDSSAKIRAARDLARERRAEYEKAVSAHFGRAMSKLTGDQR
jgi:hypothetical protein